LAEKEKLAAEADEPIEEIDETIITSPDVYYLANDFTDNPEELREMCALDSEVSF
jgi:hypothetical protein